jgi:hypothetical protein
MGIAFGQEQVRPRNDDVLYKKTSHEENSFMACSVNQN